MVKIERKVRIQAGGKIEVISSDLPAGQEADVTVTVQDESTASDDCVGLFADEVELMDRIVDDAMAAREHPLRYRRG